jgi:hypothetical protein
VVAIAFGNGFAIRHESPQVAYRLVGPPARPSSASPSCGCSWIAGLMAIDGNALARLGG